MALRQKNGTRFSGQAGGPCLWCCPLINSVTLENKSMRSMALDLRLFVYKVNLKYAVSKLPLKAHSAFAQLYLTTCGCISNCA